MDKKRLEEASLSLTSYSEARKLQELRLLENEEWFRMRNYDGLGIAKSGRALKMNRDSVTSAYLFHAIEGKHSDAMDNIPSAYIRAQEPDDEMRARILSEVLPKVLERSGFREAYSKNWYEKPKHGTGVYYVGYKTPPGEYSPPAPPLRGGQDEGTQRGGQDEGTQRGGQDEGTQRGGQDEGDSPLPLRGIPPQRGVQGSGRGASSAEGGLPPALRRTPPYPPSERGARGRDSERGASLKEGGRSSGGRGLRNDGGEVVVKAAELLRLYWQPGIEDIQDSENLFYLEYTSAEQLRGRYPDVDWDAPGIDLTPPIDPPRYVDEELSNPDSNQYTMTNKAASGLVCVCDWYYKKWKNGKQILHLCKYCGDTVIFSSEDEEGYEDGFYEDGKYPFVFDVMFPEKGTPAGFGLIAVGKQAQRYIDRLDANLLEQALLNSRPQTLYSEDLGLDVRKLADKNNQFIPFTGRITPDNLYRFETKEPNANTIAIRQQKINELKELTNNRDFASGGTSGGVTAASAISLLQASGNKASRDFITETWACFKEICELVLSRMRQFYSGKRVFRISGRRAERLARDMYKAGALDSPPGIDEPLAVEFDAADIFRAGGETPPVGYADTPLWEGGKAPPVGYADTPLREGGRTGRGGQGLAFGTSGAEDLWARQEDELWREEINPRDVLFDIELDSQNTSPMNELQDNQTMFSLLDRGLLNPENAEMLLTVLDVITIGSKQELIAYAERGIQRQQEQAAAMAAQAQLSAEQQMRLPQPPAWSPATAQGMGLGGAPAAAGSPTSGAQSGGGGLTAMGVTPQAEGMVNGMAALGSDVFAG